MPGIESLPLELLREITKDIHGPDLSHLQLSCRYLRSSLLERQWEHVVFEHEVPADPTTTAPDTNQFDQVPYPSLEFGAQRLIRISNDKRLREFCKWWDNRKLEFLPSVTRKLSFSGSFQSDAVRRIVSKLQSADSVELYPSSVAQTELFCTKLFPSARFHLNLNLPNDDFFAVPSAESLQKCAHLRLTLGEISSAEEKVAHIVASTSSSMLESLHVDYGTQQQPQQPHDTQPHPPQRRNRQPISSLTSEYLHSLLEKSANLKSLRLYWPITRIADYDWVPDSVELLQLQESEPGSSRARGAIVLENIRTLELETKYARFLRRVHMPNLVKLSIRPVRFGQLENQVDAVSTLRMVAKARDQQLKVLDTDSLSFGAIMEFSTPHIEVLALKTITGGTTAFTDMTQTMEDFLLSMSKLFPGLQYMYVEIRTVIVQDQFRSILGYYVRRKKGLKLYFGFQDAQLVKRILGTHLLEGSMARVNGLIPTPYGPIVPSLDYHVYRFDPSRFY